jgi:hypothetical protein
MTVKTEDIRKAQSLIAARNPTWVKQTQSDAAPSSLTSGTDLQSVIKTTVAVGCRINPAFKTAKLGISNYDDQDTYEVRISNISATHSPTSGDTETETLEGIRDAINAESNINVKLTATVVGDEVVLEGDTEGSYTVFASGHSGFEVTHEDADSCDVRLWVQAGGSGDDKPERWFKMNGGEFACDKRGLVERFATAGFDRLYVEADNVSPQGSVVSIFVGPARVE